ncbi:MAG: lysylphosphatidylglycerol synthase transmembrane domain-containing protein [Caldilineaceae bacterium]
MRYKDHIINFIKIAVGLGLLYFLYTRLKDPAGLWTQVATSNKMMLTAALVVYAAAVASSGVKWGILLRANGIRMTVGRLLAYQWLAEFFNNFLPAQVGGDVMRGYALATDTHRRADAAASVLIDRFMGLFVFMVAAAVATTTILFRGRPNGVPFSGDELVALRVMVLGSVAIAAVLVAVLTAMLSRRLKQLAERLLARLPLSDRTMPIWQKLSEAFNAYRYQYSALLLSALGSVFIVVLTSVQIWLIAEAIDPGQLSLLEVLVINPIIVLLLVAVPLSPGGLGVRQGAFSIMFFLIGAGSDLGYGVGLLQQVIVYLVSLPGLILWLRGRRVVEVVEPTVGTGAVK